MTTLAIKNIHERITTFAECLVPLDDSSSRSSIDCDVYCSNCGCKCIAISFMGRTIMNPDRTSTVSTLCKGCARAFQHCARRGKTMVSHLLSFFHCFHSGFLGKATTGVHPDYKNLPLPLKINCFNCGCRCADEYFHGVRTFTQIASASDLFSFPDQPNFFVDICLGCCRAFYVSQAFMFATNSIAYEFAYLGMNPLKSLTKEDHWKQYSELMWTIDMLREACPDMFVQKVPKFNIVKGGGSRPLRTCSF